MGTLKIDVAQVLFDTNIKENSILKYIGSDYNYFELLILMNNGEINQNYNRCD